MHLSLFIIDVFTVTLCPVFIEDKCYVQSQRHFVRDHHIQWGVKVHPKMPRKNRRKCYLLNITS